MAYIFNINKSTFAKEIYHIVLTISSTIDTIFLGTTLGSGRISLTGILNMALNVVSMIDATAHKIRRPSGPRQVESYACYRVSFETQ